MRTDIHDRVTLFLDTLRFQDLRCFFDHIVSEILLEKSAFRLVQGRIGRYRDLLLPKIVPDIPDYFPIRKLPEVIKLHNVKDQARRIQVWPASFPGRVEYRQLGFDPFWKKPSSDEYPFISGSLVQGCPVAVPVFIRNSVAVCLFVSGRFCFNSIFILDFLTVPCHGIMAPRRATRRCLQLSEPFYPLMLCFWVFAF